MGVMRVLDHTGDSVVTWEPDDATTVDAAEEIFARLSSQRKMAFARPAGRPASDATLIRRFDPAAEEIIWVRPIQGG